MKRIEWKISAVFAAVLVGIALTGCAASKHTGESPLSVTLRQGKILLDKGDYRGAVKMFRKAVGYDPQNAQAYRGLGLAYYGLGDDYRAEIFLRKAIQLDPSMTDLWGYIGDLYLQRGDEKTAMKYFEKCPPEDPHYAELHFRLGKMRLERGDTAAAREEFQKALSRSDFWGGYWGMGKLAELAGDWNSALNWYRQASNYTNDPLVNLALADAYYNLGHYVPAYFYYTLYIGECGGKVEKYVRKRHKELEKMVNIQTASDEYKLEFALDKNNTVKVGVFSKDGKLVKMLFEGMLARGKYDLKWDGKDQQGNPVDSGEYIGFVKLGKDDKVILKKFVVR